MYPPLPRLGDYDVSPLNGFLPSEPPCELLSDRYYAPWESVVRNLHSLLLTKRLRGVVQGLPVLYTDLLRDESEWRRAYSILGIITHAYVWGADSPADVVPQPISIPFLETCDHLDLPPVATYAGTVLWNWKLINPAEPVDSLENIFTLHTLTGSMDESWFFLVSVAIEARSGPLIPILLDAILAARYGDEEAVTEALRAFAERLDELGALLARMYDSCDPHVFYHRIRPYLAGWKNMEDAGLPKGVLFDTGSASDAYVQLSGGSNAQSSIFQFFDIVLGVEHRPTGASRAAAAADPPSSSAVGGASNSFIHDMRRYMPGPHRRFLEHVERVANLRDFVSARADANAALRTAYDACLAMLRAFRDAHIRIVSRYIIAKSRGGGGHASSGSASSAGSSAGGRLNLASASSKMAAAGPPSSDGGAATATAGLRRLRGTGGTALIPFLKQARDETGEPAIDAWARRLLSNGPAMVSPAYAGGGARLSKIGEHASGEREIVGLAGVWRIDDSEGGICHW